MWGHDAAGTRAPGQDHGYTGRETATDHTTTLWGPRVTSEWHETINTRSQRRAATTATTVSTGITGTASTTVITTGTTGSGSDDTSTAGSAIQICRVASTSW